MLGCLRWKRFYGSIWKCFYNKNRKTDRSHCYSEKESKEILIEDFAEKLQNQSINIDLSVFIDSVV